MALLEENRSVLLRRVQAAEEMDLPSLPSFTHDLDDDLDDTDDPYYGNGNQDHDEEDDLSTPHVARYRSPPATGSTIVPRQRTPIEEPTPLARKDTRESPGAYTSTPYAEQLRMSMSSRPSLGTSTASRQSRVVDHWESDASTDRLPVPDPDDLPEPSFSLDPGATVETFDLSIMETPMPRGLMAKRASPITTAIRAVPDSRIPSLSRSEVSGTDNEATTPDGPTRFLEQIDEPTHDYPTHEYNTTVASVSPQSEHEALSPLKPEATPSAIRYMDMPNTVARAAATPFTTHMVPLRDVTTAFRNRDRESTPSPGNSPVSEYATPRAAPSEADRRKSHLLTVLATSKLPSRFKARGTPHPVRRISLVPDASSILEENSIANTTLDASFVSIASSQDLTMDRRGSRLIQNRGNTSVPNILLGTGTAASPGGPENRAEFVKIGKHTNMMNNALHDENNRLAQELQDWQNEYTWLNDLLKAKGIEVTDEGEVILPALNQSTSSTRSSAARVDQLEGRIREQDDMVAELENKATAATATLLAAEKAREEAEAAHVALQEQFAKKTKDHAAQFADICADYEAQIDELKHERDAARDDASQAHADATLAKSTAATAAASSVPSHEVNVLKDKIAALETDLQLAHADADAAADEAEAAKHDRAELEHDVADLQNQLHAAEDEAARLRLELDDAQHDDDEQIAALKARILEAEEDKKDADLALETATARVADLQKIISAKDEQADKDAAAARATIVDLEQQLDERDEEESTLRREVAELESELDTCRSTLADKEADLATLQTALDVAQMAADKTMDTSILQELQDRLSDATREVEHLKKELDAVPERKLALEARDARIRALEVEKETLQDRVRSREYTTASTPARSMVTSTPIVNRVLANLRTPATPGPLKEFSWLQTTIGDSNESILRAQLDHLQHELDSANSLLDKNFNRLEAAGVNSISLSEMLARAKSRIHELEEQLRHLARDNQQSLASLNLDRNKNERLENALDEVHEQLSALKGDTAREKERLGEELRRVRSQYRDLQAKAEEQIEELGEQIVEIRREADDKATDADEQLAGMRTDKDTISKNLKAARATISRLEAEIRSLTTANAEAKRELQGLKSAALDAARGSDALRAARDQLRDASAETDSLRQTLRERNLSLEEAEHELGVLKAERTRTARDIAAFGDDLAAQRRECARFGNELDALRASKDAEAARARTEISRLAADLQWSEERLAGARRAQQAAEREYAAVEARALEAERRARDLRENMARTTDADSASAAAASAAAASAAAAAASAAAEEMRAKYRVQVRRLSAQIEYLKARFARENTFRSALALQKKFLLLLVGGLSLNEQATLRAIASMGFPASEPTRPTRSFKAVGLAVVATIRARRMAEAWARTREVRSAGTRK